MAARPVGSSLWTSTDTGKIRSVSKRQLASDSPKVFGFRQAMGLPVAAISRSSVIDHFEIA